MKKFLLFLTIAAGAIGATAQSLPPKVTHFDWSQFSYTYTEANGETKTANLTDPATTTDQIIALLRAVYINKDVPGIRYAYMWRNPETGELLLNRKMHYRYNYTSHSDKSEFPNGGGGNPNNTWPRSLDKNAGIVVPDTTTEDGMTVMLVQLKNSWVKPSGAKSINNARKTIDTAFQSVQVVTAFTRVHDENNPGYLFAIDGAATNKFFFISKGKSRGGSASPMFRLFEQISPVKGDNAVTTYDFISKMKSGEVYYCLHDCYEVTTYAGDKDRFGNPIGHWFTISNEGEAYSLKNLCLYVPDRRFENERKNMDPVQDEMTSYDDQAKYYTNYGVKDGNSTNDSIIRPKVFMYTANLHAEAVPDEEVEDYYRVNLAWSTSLTDQKVGAHVPEHYYVYIVHDDGSWERIDHLLGENEPVEGRTGSYLVEQTYETQTFNYVITAHPINYYMGGTEMIMDGMDTVNTDCEKPLVTITAISPVRTVVIPPLGKPFFQRLMEYRSYYDVNTEQNYYRNTITVGPAHQETLKYLKNFNGSFEMVRTDPAGLEIPFARVTFQQLSGEEGFSYNVDYIEGTQDETEIGLFGDNSVITSGTIKSMTDDIRIVDRFPASTMFNDHFDHYDYTMVQITDDDLAEVCSNPLTAPVLKTNSKVEQMQYTLEDVRSDDDHHLDAKPCNVITFDATYNPMDNLVEYDALRVNPETHPVGEFKVGKAENFDNSGRYDVFSVDKNGALNVLEESRTISVGELSNISVMDKNGAVAEARSYYVPVIISLFGGIQTKVNTYGCDIKPMAYPTLDLNVSRTLKTNPYNVLDELGNTVQRMTYATELMLTPSLPEEIKNAYYYRIWRVVDGNTVLEKEALLNSVADYSGSNGQANWGTDYTCLKKVYPGNDELSVIDLMVDKPYEGSKKVTYIARLYATHLDNESSSQEGIDPVRGDGNEDEDYVVAEDVVEVEFNDSTYTGIEELDGDEVSAVTYYNLQGVPSNRPYDGVNIVKVLYKNGKTVTTKEMR